jgi:putative transposase
VGDDEGIEVHGRAEGVHFEAGSRWSSGCGDLPQGRDRRATYFNWKKRYEGLLPDEMRRLKQLEDENGKLKKLVADLSLDKAMLQEVLCRKL